MAAPRPRARAALAALAAAGALALAGCGGDSDGGRPAQGPPQARHGAEAVDRLARLERLRSDLVATGDLAALSRRPEALRQLEAARRAWRAQARDARAEDPALEREVTVAFRRAERALRESPNFEGVRMWLAPLRTQLLDGAVQTLVPAGARRDPGAKAVAILRLLDAMEREVTAVEFAGEEAAAIAHALAWALLTRAQGLAREIAEDLGPERDAVVEGLVRVRGLFPEAAAPPAEPVAAGAVRERNAPVRRALRERFGLR